MDESRRSFLGVAVVGLVAAKTKAKAEPHAEVTTAEDLMREHGVLRRVLLAYDEIAGRIERKQGYPAVALDRAASLVRSFVEDYHEKLEEDFIFPRLKAVPALAPLVETLLAQHQAGRALTERVQKLSGQTGQDAAIAQALRAFTAMYAPHAAREDTELFPALHSQLSRHEYDELGETFEKRERELFHGDGFDRALEQVKQIEQQLGIADLAKFTPKL
jgi:hemerythrin-like domain-containing protein